MVRYLGSFEDEPSGHLLIVLELAAGGDLAKFLARCVQNAFNTGVPLERALGFKIVAF